MSSKGITPVIAVVLLITISIAATSAAYEFIMSAQQDAKDNFEQKFSQQELEENTELDIENVYRSGSYAIISVRNTGTIEHVIETKEENGDSTKYWVLYMNNNPVGPDSEGGTAWEYINGNRPSGPDKPVVLNPGSTININTTMHFTSGQNSFRLIGRYGSRDTYICQGAQC